MSDETRAALVDELYGIVSDFADAVMNEPPTNWHRQVEAKTALTLQVMPIIDRLLADRAVAEPAADAVERAAKAIYARNQKEYGYSVVWVQLPDAAQEKYREVARAALQAAGYPD